MKMKDKIQYSNRNAEGMYLVKRIKNSKTCIRNVMFTIGGHKKDHHASKASDLFYRKA